MCIFSLSNCGCFSQESRLPFRMNCRCFSQESRLPFNDMICAYLHCQIMDVSAKKVDCHFGMGRKS